MIVRWGLLEGHHNQTDSDFRTRWIDRHVPDVLSGAPALRHYIQNVVVDDAHRSPFPTGGLSFAGFSQLEFDSVDDMHFGMAQLRSRRELDLSAFVAKVQTLVAVRKMDRAPPVSGSGALVKRISLLRRRLNVSAEEFQHEWWGEHSALVAELPGFVGYAQNLVVDRLPNDGGASYDELPIDGLVEFWFDGEEGMARCYASPEFERVAAHGRTFIADISTFLVDEHIAR